MRFQGKMAKVASTAVALVFGFALCSIPVKLVGGAFEPKDSNKKLKAGSEALVEAFRRISQESADRLSIPCKKCEQPVRKSCTKCETIEHNSRWGMTHFQGIALPENHIIFTSSVDDGYIVFGEKNGHENYVIKRQPIGKNYSHPGGIQTIGDRVVVPVEGGGKSEIRFYNYKGKFRQEKGLTIYRGKELGQAGSVGITNYKSREGERYLLATIPKQKKKGEQEVHFYWTQPNKPLSDPDCSFGDPKSGKFSDESNGFRTKLGDYINSMSLVADEAGNIFFIGMYHHNGKDYADLHKIDLNVNDKNGEPKLSFLAKFKFKIPKTESCKGCERSIFRVRPSFRWGGGVLVASPTTVKVFACAHDLLTDKKVVVSIFRAD